mmetsp:Transcript_137159/g.273646  ORF Transcript_137159/g.273646 Transcript_137159/m.273646 type:complete len:300 (+) Transcript_137159:35-934(+)
MVWKRGSNSSLTPFLRKSRPDFLPEASEDDSCSDDTKTGQRTSNQHKMKTCHPRVPKSELEIVMAQLQTLKNAGWEKRLAALEALEIENRLKQLECVNAARFGIQPGHEESDNFERHCAPTLHATAGQDGMPATVTTDAALFAMQKDTTVSPEINDLVARIRKRDDAKAELQPDCELQATQWMGMLHQGSGLLTRERENHEQLRHEVEVLQQRFDSAFHELRLKCQILECQCHGLVSKGSSSPHQSFCGASPTLSDQQNMHNCLRSSLLRMPPFCPRPQRPLQLQVLPNDNTDGISKPT